MQNFELQTHFDGQSLKNYRLSHFLVLEVPVRGIPSHTALPGIIKTKNFPSHLSPGRLLSLQNVGLLLVPVESHDIVGMLTKCPAASYPSFYSGSLFSWEKENSRLLSYLRLGMILPPILLQWSWLLIAFPAGPSSEVCLVSPDCKWEAGIVISGERK